MFRILHRMVRTGITQMETYEVCIIVFIIDQVKYLGSPFKEILPIVAQNKPGRRYRK